MKDKDELYEFAALSLTVMVRIKEQQQRQGVIECPKCKGKLYWSKASSNGHIRAKCESHDCIQFME